MTPAALSKLVVEARKFLIVVGGLIATMTAYGLLHGNAAKAAAAVLAALTALGVYQVPNGTTSS